MGIVRTLLNTASGLFFPDGDDTSAAVEEDVCRRILEEAEAARAEWLSAKSYFDNVTDPDLVDHAIYYVEAAERKYMYLLKQARMHGITLDKNE